MMMTFFRLRKMPNTPSVNNIADPGPILCSCFDVGVNTILTAIESQGLTTVEAIGEALQAGTNCGSCRPEIATLLAKFKIPEAAE